MTTYAGWAINDRAALLDALQRQGVTPAHDDVIADHVTYAYPADTAPGPAAVVIVGHAHDDRVQALVARVDGTTRRPDGRTFHITLSTAPGVEAAESNRLLEGRWTMLRTGPVRVPVTPFLRETD